MSKTSERHQPTKNKPTTQAETPTMETDQDEITQGASDHGIVRDAQGQDQPADKSRAQHVSRKDAGGDPPGDPHQ